MKYIVCILSIVLVAVHCGGQKTKVTGLVEVGSVFGFVTNENYDPISTAQVTIVGDKESVTFTNEAGYFIIDNLAPGRYNILVTKSGYEGYNVSVDVTPEELKEHNIVLTERRIWRC